MIAPATSGAADVARALHADAHADLADVTLSTAEREAIVAWLLDAGRTFGPDTDAREIFAEALARWEVSESYRRDLLAFLTYPEPFGRTRAEAEAEISSREEARRDRARERARLARAWWTDPAEPEPAPVVERLADVIPLSRRRTA